MKERRNKLDVGCLVGVVFRELEHQLEGSTFPGSVVGTENHSLPQHNVGVHGLSLIHI